MKARYEKHTKSLSKMAKARACEVGVKEDQATRVTQVEHKALVNHEVVLDMS